MSLFKNLASYAIIVFSSCLIVTSQATTYSQNEASINLKGILTQATKSAISELGKSGGFSNKPEVKISLPNKLNAAANLLKKFGLGSQLTQLEKGMNAAAEAAIPEAQQILVNSIQQMTFQDAKAIVTGGNTAATAYLEKTNRSQLFNKFLPKVKAITDQHALAGQYNTLVKKASFLGIKSDQMSIENYVTNKALDGLFKVMGERESYIRNHPVEAASSIAKKIFNLLNKQ